MNPTTLNQWQFTKNGKLEKYNPGIHSIAEKIISHATQYSQKPAIIGVADQSTVTYLQLATALQNALLFFRNKLNLKPADSIALLMENQPELLIVNWTAWSSGLKTVPLDIKRDTLERKMYKLTCTQAKVLIVRTDQADKKELTELAKKLPNLKIINISSTQNFLSKIKATQTTGKKISFSSDFNSPCLVLFTSGTTGLPKGCLLTPNSLCADADQIIHWLQINHDDRFHILLPLHHINSTTFSLATILAGGTIILSPHYSKSRFWQTMAQHQATLASIVPTIAYDLLSETASFEKYQNKLTQISRIQIGSAPVQPTVVIDFITKYRIRLIQGYGSSETSLRCTGIPITLPKKQYLDLVAQNSIGIEMKNDNVTVMDVNAKEVGPNQEGEICIRGPIVMRGYLDNPQATSKTFAGGWFHSGDLGYYQIIDKQKLFFLKGRLKEIIIKGGTNISPLSIENALLKAFPTLKTCYAIGFTNPRFGEEIGIVVDGPQKTIDIIKQKIATQKIPQLSSYEHPVALLQVPKDHLPTTSTGKIQRIEIKKLYSDRLRNAFLTIFQNQKNIFRIIEPDEEKIITQIVKIHNHSWPQSLATTDSVVAQQAQNGTSIGVFEKNNPNTLQGVISCLKINYADLQHKIPWTQSWNTLTANGTYVTNNSRGDCIVCCSISMKSFVYKNSIQKSAKKEKLTPRRLNDFLASKKDKVTNFHKLPKGSYKNGAKILQVIKNGRPDDQASLGYNVLFKYPVLTKQPTIDTKQSLGVQLIEAAMRYAFRHKIKHVTAYSRPASLSQYYFE